MYHHPVAIVCDSSVGDGDNDGTIVETVNVGFVLSFSFLKTLLSISQPNIMSKKGRHQSKIDDCSAIFIYLVENFLGNIPPSASIGNFPLSGKFPRWDFSYRPVQCIAVQCRV